MEPYREVYQNDGGILGTDMDRAVLADLGGKASHGSLHHHLPHFQLLIINVKNMQNSPSPRSSS